MRSMKSTSWWFSFSFSLPIPSCSLSLYIFIMLLNYLGLIMKSSRLFPYHIPSLVLHFETNTLKCSCLQVTSVFLKKYAYIQRCLIDQNYILINYCNKNGFSLYTAFSLPSSLFFYSSICFNIS